MLKSVPNRSSLVGPCGACNGDGFIDCAGVPCGTSVYDVCDVCNGDGTSCLDCAGVTFGSKVFDSLCDVCDGNNDCASITFTGDVANDFDNSQCTPIIVDSTTFADVGGYPGLGTSGWDMIDVRVRYDPLPANLLHVG